MPLWPIENIKNDQIVLKKRITFFSKVDIFFEVYTDIAVFFHAELFFFITRIWMCKDNRKWSTN